jgi:gliding motility-associated protein GldM
LYERVASALGEQKYSGFIKLETPSGVKEYPFESDFNVGAPSATISADLMNVFYAGIDNDVSVSVPGVAASSVNVSMTGGTLERKGNGYIAKNLTAGKEVTISVTAQIDGKTQSMGSKNFRVKLLPLPVAYLPFTDKDGNPAKYKGGVPGLAKNVLTNAADLKAELDDADIQAFFKVTSFEMNVSGVMGDRILPSSGANFTNDQLNEIKQMSRGKKFFLGNIKANGPDGKTRSLRPLEIVVN